MLAVVGRKMNMVGCRGSFAIRAFFSDGRARSGGWKLQNKLWIWNWHLLGNSESGGWKKLPRWKGANKGDVATSNKNSGGPSNGGKINSTKNWFSHVHSPSLTTECLKTHTWKIWKFQLENATFWGDTIEKFSLGYLSCYSSLINTAYPNWWTWTGACESVPMKEEP